MFKSLIVAFLVTTLLLASSGVALGCAEDLGHACHQSICGAHEQDVKEPADPPEDSGQHACVQACGAHSVSIQPNVTAHTFGPDHALALLVYHCDPFVPSSEPRSIFHPPA